MSNYLPDSFYAKVMSSIANIGAIEGGLEAWATSINTAISELQEDNGFSGAWNDITGKPSTFTPSAHGHSTGDITGFNAAVDARIQNIVGAAPAAFDTLVEIATQLQNDENVVAALTATVAEKSKRSNFTVLSNVAAHGIADSTASATTNLTTNYNALTSLLTLAQGLNDANAAQNALGVNYIDLANKFNTLLTKVTAIETAINNLKTAGAAA